VPNARFFQTAASHPLLFIGALTMTANAAPSAKPYLQIQGLVKKFGDNYAVDHIDLDIEQHEIFALLGSSGSGKSTLLRMLAGMETPNQGKIILDGQDITGLAPYERPINMMFQSYALFPHMTVEQNIAFGLKQDKMAKGEINARVEEMLRLVQMSKFAKRKPHQLSGGQQQRVALARSLAKRPKILLLDEPLGALDKKLRQQTQLELVNTLEQVGVTCIMVTHDQEEAMTMATRVAIMSEGQLQQVGTPSDVYDFPNSRFTAEFIGETNIFEGTVVDDHADYAIIQCPNWMCRCVSITVWAAPPSKICGSASARKILIYTKKNPKAWAITTGRKARWKKSPIWAASRFIT
jgi:putrescine transport system ATP-binding protein